MTDLREIVERWQRGWGVARGLPAAEDVGGGLRVRCLQPGRDVEYVALDDDAVPELAGRVLREDEVTWLTVATASPQRAAKALETAGLTLLKRAEQLMAIELREHPQSALAEPYRLELADGGGTVTATVRGADGSVTASGVVGLSGADAIADRIETAAAHRRRGLAGAVMGALARAARERGAAHGILVASEDGQRLYRRLGWRPVADVLIATGRQLSSSG